MGTLRRTAGRALRAAALAAVDLADRLDPQPLPKPWPQASTTYTTTAVSDGWWLHAGHPIYFNGQEWSP